MTSVTEYLKSAIEKKASDVFIIAGSPVSFRLEGELVHADEERISVEQSEMLINEIYGLSKRQSTIYAQRGDDDFSFALPGLARFRVNAYRQRGSMAAVIRIVAFDIPDYRDMSIPEQIMKVAQYRRGMVIFTGTAGVGKSTTQACVIDRINITRGVHVVTLEDPIEYLYRNKKSIVSQREISIDAESYVSALRACLRQAPDVIQLGEMRDYDTIRTAITAAETGHLVLATLHTDGAANAIDRMIDAFPPAQQLQIRVQLSAVLSSVISQKLLPTKEGGMIAAFEIMHMNNAIRSMIREGKTHQINNTIRTAAAEDMITMDSYILNLHKQGVITSETAVSYAANPDQLARETGLSK